MFEELLKDPETLKQLQELVIQNPNYLLKQDLSKDPAFLTHLTDLLKPEVQKSFKTSELPEFISLPKGEERPLLYSPKTTKTSFSIDTTPIVGPFPEAKPVFYPSKKMDIDVFKKLLEKKQAQEKFYSPSDFLFEEGKKTFVTSPKRYLTQLIETASKSSPETPMTMRKFIDFVSRIDEKMAKNLFNATKQFAKSLTKLRVDPSMILDLPIVNEIINNILFGTGPYSESNI
mgnify:CR=1 FL=1